MRHLSIVREFSAERLNAIVNHPDVRPWVGGGAGILDLSSIVSDLRNYLLMTEGGGFLFVMQEPGVYEVHSQFLPDHRGEGVITAANDAAYYMFTRTDCLEILSKVPEGNVAATAFARRMKWELQFERPKVWPGPDGLVGVKYYRRDLWSWARDASDLDTIGEWFHQKLGQDHAIHDDDDAHDRYVGMACEMITHGQIDKGIWAYNRWARFAGYATVSLMSTNPVVIDIQDAILAVRGEDFDVLLVR